MYEPLNLSRVLEDAAASHAGLTLYPPGDTENPSRITYHELLVSAKHKARLLSSFAATADRPIVLLHFDNHLDMLHHSGGL